LVPLQDPAVFRPIEVELEDHPMCRIEHVTRVLGDERARLLPWSVAHENRVAEAFEEAALEPSGTRRDIQDQAFRIQGGPPVRVPTIVAAERRR
jgi:hypothetical protein